MSSALVAVFVTVFVALVSGEEVLTNNGNCPSYTPVQNFQASRLSGNWIAAWGLRKGLESPDLNCLRSNNQVSESGVFNTTIMNQAGYNQIVTRNIIGTPIDGQPGKLAYTKSQNPQWAKTTTFLDTDYDNYAVFATCIQEGGKNGYKFAIVSRKQTLAQQLVDQAKQAIPAANINQENWKPVRQNNCNQNN